MLEDVIVDPELETLLGRVAELVVVVEQGLVAPVCRQDRTCDHIHIVAWFGDDADQRLDRLKAVLVTEILGQNGADLERDPLACPVADAKRCNSANEGLSFQGAKVDQFEVLDENGRLQHDVELADGCFRLARRATRIAVIFTDDGAILDDRMLLGGGQTGAHHGEAKSHAQGFQFCRHKHPHVSPGRCGWHQALIGG